MDSWASDGFYSHFPSYSQQPTRREELARARQLDYQTFLNNVTPRKTKSDGRILKRNTNIDTYSKKSNVKITNSTFNTTPNDDLPKLDLIPNSTESNANCSHTDRNQYVSELEKMNLPDILNEDTITERNRKLAEEKRLKNIQYQQELMIQIQNKKREQELQRAKEQEEETRFLKKMEEQLKIIRLQDDIEKQRQSREHQLINVEINKPIVNSQYNKPPTTVRSEQLEPNVHTFRSSDDQKAQSERGKENREFVKNNNKSVYNFFTNSAHNQTNQLTNIRHSHYFDIDESSDNEVKPNSMSSSLYNTYPKKSIYHEQPVCIFCKHNRSQIRMLNRDNSYICGSCENDPICLNCRREICVQCKRPANKVESLFKGSPRYLKQRNRDIKMSKTSFKTLPSKLPSKPERMCTKSFQQIQTDEDESSSDSHDHKPPYSFNIAESSVFHPSKSTFNRRLSVSIRNGEVFVQPDSFDELKRITEEKLMKLSKSYGEIRAKKQMELNDNDSTSKQESDPKPILRENTKRLIEFAKELEQSDHNMYDRIESKHQVEAVQKKQISENSDTNTSTLTQVGAIKKQLQLDKLNF